MKLMLIRKIKKKHVAALLLPMVAVCAMLWIVDLYISEAAEGAVYDSIDAIPCKPAALVLGTAKHAHGRENRFYNHRLDAAAKLFIEGKVRAILASGDNSTSGYDEPTQMKIDLEKRGVPGKYITLDYAGFRTLDSVVRAKEVFGLDDYIIVSQRFHCERALYIAREKGHRATAFAAKQVSGIFGVKVRLREVLARCKAFLDVKLLGTKPRFLGKKEEVVFR